MATAVGVAGLVTLPEAAAHAADGPPRRRRLGRRPVASDRQGFNRRWYAENLREVYVPTSVDDVADHVDAALTRHGRRVRVASGRHCFENFVYGPDTDAIIDMSLLGAAGYDRERGAHFVDAGCQLWTAYRALLNVDGRTIPGGSCYSVGAGGHIAGGGYGFLSRLHGLTIDHVSAVDVVTWDAAKKRATLRHVSARSRDKAERDLFWALCGAGGGNFGVIARFWFEDPPEAPGLATVWSLAWTWADMPPATIAAFLAEYADMCATAPDAQFSSLRINHIALGSVSMAVQLVSRPGVSEADHRRQAGATIDGIRRRFARVTRAVPREGTGPAQPELVPLAPTSESQAQYTYLEAVQALDGTGDNQFGKYKSAYMRQPFPADQIDAIYTWLHTIPTGLASTDMEQSLLQVDSYGGAVNRRSSSVTPLPQRSSIMKLQYQTYWQNSSPVGQGASGPYEAQYQAHLQWIRNFYQDVYSAYGGTPNPSADPTGTVDGCYYNYPDNDLGTHAEGTVENALQLYFGDNLRSNRRNLVDVKARWDPQDLFHGPQSIPVR
jgi:hypothetical protein